MSLEHSPGPQEGQTRKVSPIWRAARRVNDGFFDHIVNPITYKVDAKEIEDVLRRYTGNGPRKVLDIGSGTGGLANAIRARGLEVACADVENHHAYPNIEFSPIVGGELPYKNAAHDLSVLRFVLHHIPNPVDALLEAKRVTQDGLLVIHEDVVRPGFLEGLQEHSYRRHLSNFNVTYPNSAPIGRTYTRDDWHGIIDEAGLQVLSEHKEHRIGPAVGHDVYVVGDAETIFEVRK